MARSSIVAQLRQPALLLFPEQAADGRLDAFALGALVQGVLAAVAAAGVAALVLHGTEGGTEGRSTAGGWGSDLGKNLQAVSELGGVRGAIRAGDKGHGDCPSLMVIQRSEMSRSLDEVMAVGTESWEGSLTSGLPPGWGLGGRASRAAASWVRKEERSHIVWWLCPLGSVPETLVAEQTVGPSGDRGRDLAAGRAQRGGLGPGEKPENRPRTCSGPLTCSFLRCFRKSLGWKRGKRELTHPLGAASPPQGEPRSQKGKVGVGTSPRSAETSQQRTAGPEQ